MNEIDLTQISRLSFLLDSSTIPTKIPKYFMFRGKLYKPILNFNQLSGGQYIDLTSYVKENPLLKTNVLAAIVCNQCYWFGQPKIYGFHKWKAITYTGDSMIKRSEIFLDLPITVVYPITLFFCQSYDNLIQAILNYLEQQATKEVKELSQMFTRGISILTR